MRDGEISRSRIAQPSFASATSVAELDGGVDTASRFHLRHAGRPQDGVDSRELGGAVGGAAAGGAREFGAERRRVEHHARRAAR